MVFRITNTWYDTATNTGANYGVTEVPAGNVLTRVEVKGELGFPTADFVDGGYGFSIVTMWGLQWLINGSSLLTLPADESDQRWLTVQSHINDGICATWAPNTDTSAVIVSAPCHIRWAGQLKATDDMELAFTTGVLGGSPTGWYLYGAMELWLG
jgi:hypothetical protein